MKQPQRTVLVTALPDTANVAAGALIFGQALSKDGYSIALSVLGVLTWLALMAFALVLADQEKKP
ncbi:MAG: hypothetical protein KGN76_06580 [Acidobacteriota bacterium]|nr:hypothetical protein [Acidobacteriota bacterium]